MNSLRIKLARPVLLFIAIALFTTAPAALADRLAEGISAFEAEDYERAYELLKPEAEAGDADAQHHIASMYAQGFYVEKDFGNAIAWFEQGHDNGNLRSTISLGYMHSEGMGAPENKSKAADLYRVAADAGWTSAQRNLGLLYKNGEGVEQDYAKAVEWFHRAAEQGDADSQYELGIAYYEGRGVDRNHDQSVYWNRKAAEAGKIHSRRLLAWHYAAGKGVEEDLDRAEELYRSVLPNGTPRDRAQLATLLRSRGVEYGNEDDLVEALALYQEAGIAGDLRSLEHVGAMHFNGWGTERDPVEGMAWLMAADALGHAPAGSLVNRLRQTQPDERIRAAEMRANTLYADLLAVFE